MKLYCRLDLAYGLPVGHLSVVVFALRLITEVFWIGSASSIESPVQRSRIRSWAFGKEHLC